MSQNQAGLPQQVINANMPSQQVYGQWVQLSVQLSQFNAIIAIDEPTFQSWTNADHQYIFSSYM
jgi:hypothetical protein